MTDVSLNEQMIEEGYAHAYDGGTKNMDLEALREIRRAHGTIGVEVLSVDLRHLSQTLNLKEKTAN